LENLYYGLRYYNPTTGRWLNRDPISELGDLIVYAFTENAPIGMYDLLGLSALDPLEEAAKEIEKEKEALKKLDETIRKLKDKIKKTSKGGKIDLKLMNQLNKLQQQRSGFVDKLLDAYKKWNDLIAKLNRLKWCKRVGRGAGRCCAVLGSGLAGWELGDWIGGWKIIEGVTIDDVVEDDLRERWFEKH
jgi:cell fate (sporulation/competence/biofilm development) regulator YlbF (YheA/YmcA/DUF963 family)